MILVWVFDFGWYFGFRLFVVIIICGCFGWVILDCLVVCVVLGICGWFVGFVCCLDCLKLVGVVLHQRM